MADSHDRSNAAERRARIVGRDQELRILDDALRSARSGRGLLVLVGGEIGIGKTALVRQFLSDHSDEPPISFIGRAYELSETPSFSIWRDLLRSPDAVALAAPALDSQTDDNLARWLDRLTAWIATIAQSGPVLIHLEDIHWADPQSLELLRQLARQIVEMPILIVATYRDVDIGRGHPLYQHLPSLVRESAATHITLRRLDRSALRELITAGQPLAPADIDRLTDYVHAASQGTPLAAEELLRTLRDEGVLAPATSGGGDWRLGALDRLLIPPLIRQIVDNRIAVLGDAGRDVIEIAAVIGEDIMPAHFPLWQELSGVDDETFRQTIDRSIELYVLRDVSATGSISFYHRLGRESVYDSIGLTRRQDLHQRIGLALASAGHPDVDEVATHLYQAHDPAGAEWLVRAAEQAQRAGDWAAAAARFEDAIALTRGIPGRDAAVGWLLYRAALMWRYLDLHRALDLLDEAHSVALTMDDAALLAGTHYHRGFVRCWLRQVQAGIAEMATAIAEIERLSDDDYSRLQIVESFGSREYGEHRGALIAWLGLAGHVHDALTLADSLDPASSPAAVGSPGLSRSGIGDGYTGRAISFAMLGEPAAASEAFEAARQAYGSVGLGHQLGESYLDELLFVSLPYYADDIGRRDWLARAAADVWSRAVPSGGMPPAAITTLPLRVIEGDWQAVRETAGQINPADRLNWIVVPALATIAIHSEDRELLSRVVAEILPAGAATLPGTTHYLAGFQLLYLSALRCVLWSVAEEAPTWIDAMERWLNWSGAVSGRAELAVARTVHAFATANLPDLDRYANEAVQLASSPRQPIVLVTAHRLLARSLIHAGRVAEARIELDSSIDLARACRHRLEEAIGMIMLSELQNRGGDRTAARSTLDEAVDTFAQIGATSWSGFVSRTRGWWGIAENGGEPRHLSRRETEVLRLVAKGLTDGDIANELSVSRRTVTTHLSSIYRKLGVSARAAATRIGVERHLI